MNKRLSISIIVLSLLSSGCAEMQKNLQETNTFDSAPITKQISASAVDIHNDLIQLNKLKEMNPHVMTAKATPKDGPLAKKITLKWVGGPEEITKTLSTLIGFSAPKIIGRPPANLKSVSLNVIARPAFEVIEDIGLQMGEQAGIVIGDKQLSVVYQ